MRHNQKFTIFVKLVELMKSFDMIKLDLIMEVIE